MRTTVLIPAFILVLAGIALSQTEPKAYKFVEISRTSSDGMTKVIESFRDELRKNADSQGYIFFYGRPNEIAKRRKLITQSVFWGHWALRITLVDIAISKSVQTTMWIVLAGAEPPRP